MEKPNLSDAPARATIEGLQIESARLRGEVARLQAQLQAAKELTLAGREGRRAALNLMEDAINAHRALETENTERRRVELALRTNEAKYRSLFESVDEGFCIIEVLFDAEDRPYDYRFIEANPAFVQQTGLADAVGRTMKELAPGHEQHWFEIYGRVAKTGETLRFENRAEALGRDFDVCAFRIGTEEVGLVAVLFRDITEHKRRQADSSLMLEISKDLETLTAPDEIMSTVGERVGRHLRLSGCIFVDVNEPSDEVVIHYGWTAGDVPGLRGTYRLRDYLTEEFQRAGRAGEIFFIEDTANDERADPESYAQLQIGAFITIPFHRRGRWTQFFCVTSKTPRAWSGEEIELLNEVSERLFARVERARAEEALRVGEERLRVALRAAGMATWDYDVVTNTMTWDDHHFQLMGLPVDPERVLRPQDFFRHVHEDDYAVMGEEMRRTIDGEGDYRADYRIRRASDSEWRWMSGFGRAMQVKDGKATRIIGVMIDITERKQAEAALHTAKEGAEAANRAKDDFLAALSHELRNPLNPVLLCASELMADTTLSRELREQLQMIHRNIELEARLIDDLLDLTHITRGKMSLHRVPNEVHELLRHTQEIVSTDAAAARVELRFALEAKDGQVLADAARLQQVFWNLIKNGIKFSSARSGGVVQVRTSNPGAGRLLVEVEDNGVGMTTAVMKKIFRPFEQGDQIGDHRFGGLGLGLAISEAVVSLHEGTLRAASAGSGQGSTFTVELATVVSPVNVAAGDGAPAPTTGPLRLLVVEDHEPTLRVLTRLLQRDGHVVHSAGNAGEALAIAAKMENECDLVMSDIGLPDRSGLELMRELKALRGWRGIAMSGYGMDADLRESKLAGFHSHLVKPLKAEVVRQAIREAMG